MRRELNIVRQMLQYDTGYKVASPVSRSGMKHRDRDKTTEKGICFPELGLLLRIPKLP